MDKNYEKTIKSKTELSEKELRNEENILKALENHDLDKMKKIGELFNLTKEQLKLSSQYAILRKEIIAKIWRDIDKRKKESPQKTNQEQKLGIYLEQLEPQVKDAVLKLQEKGYKTYESGFKLFGDQMIGFSEEYFKNSEILKNLQNELKKENINLEIKYDHINISFKKFYSVKEMKEVWDRIADGLPKLLNKPSE